MNDITNNIAVISAIDCDIYVKPYTYIRNRKISFKIKFENYPAHVAKSKSSNLRSSELFYALKCNGTCEKNIKIMESRLKKEQYICENVLSSAICSKCMEPIDVPHYPSKSGKPIRHRKINKIRPRIHKIKENDTKKRIDIISWWDSYIVCSKCWEFPRVTCDICGSVWFEDDYRKPGYKWKTYNKIIGETHGCANCPHSLPCMTCKELVMPEKRIEYSFLFDFSKIPPLMRCRRGPFHWDPSNKKCIKCIECLMCGNPIGDLNNYFRPGTKSALYGGHNIVCANCIRCPSCFEPVPNGELCKIGKGTRTYRYNRYYDIYDPKHKLCCKKCVFLPRSETTCPFCKMGYRSMRKWRSARVRIEKSVLGCRLCVYGKVKSRDFKLNYMPHDYQDSIMTFAMSCQPDSEGTFEGLPFEIQSIIYKYIFICARHEQIKNTL